MKFLSSLAISLAVVCTILMVMVYAAPSSLTSIDDAKALKTLLKSRNNVLVVYTETAAQLREISAKLEQAGRDTTGIGAIATCDCSANKETKKICKKLDGAAMEKGVAIKYYKNGVYNKDYTRPIKPSVIVGFLNAPDEDMPWADEGNDVVHLTDSNFDSVVAKKRPMLVMFYAPWCGHCKQAKPAFAEAARELKQSKSKWIIAGIDVVSPSGIKTGKRFDVKGYPTIKYFADGAFKFDTAAIRTKPEIMDFIAKPSLPPPPPPPEAKWSDTDQHVTHLTAGNWKSTLAANPSALVMFYAPWCGHCKTAKPHYSAAAAQMKEEGITGLLAAIDATEFPAIGKQYGVEGYPTIIYFKKGKEAWKYQGKREQADFVEYMKNPVETAAPAAEPKWSEQGNSVVHLGDSSLPKYLKKNKNKHILVMFYAPWCGHCKQMKPEWATVASDLVTQGLPASLAAVDCTEDGKQLQSTYKVTGFPTIKYFYDGKFVSDYTGGRQAADIKAFINSKLVNDSDDNDDDDL